jgi:hypothetical protein
MRSGHDHRASNPGISSDGHRKVGGVPRADQSRARTRGEYIAKEKGLIVPHWASGRRQTLPPGTVALTASILEFITISKGSTDVRQ